VNAGKSISIRNTRLRGILFFLAFAIWLVIVGFAFHKAMQWESSPGKAASAPLILPTKTDRTRLVLVIHAMCPCSYATLKNVLSLPPSELAQVDITVVFTGPGATSDSTAPNIRLAKTLKTASLIYCGEQEAVQKYHAHTSGQCFIYNRTGNLVFSGGLTSTRGGEGDSAGLNALRLTLQGKECPSMAPVFGCALETPQEKT
jgi:hypothetical protein